MPDKGSGWDETGSSWRYRVASPDDFIKTTFRTKNITDGVSLVLAKRTKDGPMETQSIIFSKDTFETRGPAEEWLDAHPDLKKPRGKSGKGEGMTGLDISNYIVVPTGSTDPADVEDLRELEGDYPRGVMALWSDAESSILAFAFEKGSFNEADAKAWVKDFGEQGAELLSTDVLGFMRTLTASVASAIGLAVNHQKPVATKMIGGKWAVMPAKKYPVANETLPWEWTADKENAIMEKGGWEMFASAHLIIDFGQSGKGQSYPQNKLAYKLPVAELIDGKLTYVLAGAQAAYGALRGGRGGVEAPASVKAEALKTIKAIYERYKRDTSSMALYSLDELRMMLQRAVDAHFPPKPLTPESGSPVSAKYVMSAYMVEYGTESVVVQVYSEAGGAISNQYLTAPYTVDENGVATFGTFEPVQPDKRWVKLIGTPVALASEPVAARSFDEIRKLVDGALYTAFGKSNEQTNGPTVRSPWIIDIGTSNAIVEWENKRYAVPYTIGADNTVTLGEMSPVTQEWARPDGSPVMLHCFSVQLASGDEANEKGDGLVWKEIIHPGQWHKTDSGRVIQVAKKMVVSAYEAFVAGLPKFVSVPADTHHYGTLGVVPAEDNRGFVEKLKLVGDRMFGGFRFTNPQVAAGVQSGDIKDVSVFLQPNVVHPQSGKKFDWVLRHVLLTNDPLVQDLAPFGVAADAANDGPVVVQRYEHDKEVTMDPVQMTEQDATLLGQFKGVGMTVDEIVALAADRKRIEAEQAKLRAKARELEIMGVVRALEATSDHPGVVKVTGYRHYPVVVAAVEKLLKEQPVALALSSDDEGHTSLDAVVLSVVNALPAEARMALSTQPEGDRKPPVTPTQRDPNAEPTPEEIKTLADKV